MCGPAWDDVHETYALALVLREEGLHDAAIAHALGIGEASVAPLLAAARAELARLAHLADLERRAEGGTRRRPLRRG
jgi:predicted transcriptional regulator